MARLQVAVSVLIAVPALGQEPATPARPTALQTSFLDMRTAAGNVLSIVLNSFINQPANKKDARNWVVVGVSGLKDDEPNLALLTADQARLIATQLWFAADAFDAAPPVLVPAAAKSAAKTTVPLRRAPTGGAAKTAGQCEAMAECGKEGLCTPFGKSCIASTDDDCERAVICQEFHRCVARAGFCER